MGLRVTIEEYEKLNGQTRWNVMLDGTIRLGQFYTRERAENFVRREVAAAYRAATGIPVRSAA